jgi:hypothetical protein
MPLAAGAGVRPRGGEGGGDQVPGLRRVDYVVQLEQGRGVERSGVLMRRLGQLPDSPLALLGILDLLELAA